LKKTFIKKCSTLPHIHTQNMGGNTIYISSKKQATKHQSKWQSNKGKGRGGWVIGTWIANGNAIEQTTKHQSGKSTKVSDETLKVMRHQSQWQSTRATVKTPKQAKH
jgi:hypothetical protein